MVNPSNKMKASADVDQCNKQKLCEAFCLDNYFVSYVSVCAYLVKMRFSIDETHQSIVLAIGIPLHSTTSNWLKWLLED